MIGTLRIVGFLLIGIGALIVASYLVEPLRAVWPWLMQLPLPIRVGLGVAAAGFLLLLGSVLHERFQDSKKEEGLLDE